MAEIQTTAAAMEAVKGCSAASATEAGAASDPEGNGSREAQPQLMNDASSQYESGYSSGDSGGSEGSSGYNSDSGGVPDWTYRSPESSTPETPRRRLTDWDLNTPDTPMGTGTPAGGALLGELAQQLYDAVHGAAEVTAVIRTLRGLSESICGLPHPVALHHYSVNSKRAQLRVEKASSEIFGDGNFIHLAVLTRRAIARVALLLPCERMTGLRLDGSRYRGSVLVESQPFAVADFGGEWHSTTPSEYQSPAEKLRRSICPVLRLLHTRLGVPRPGSPSNMALQCLVGGLVRAGVDVHGLEGLVRALRLPTGRTRTAPQVPDATMNQSLGTGDPCQAEANAKAKELQDLLRSDREPMTDSSGTTSRETDDPLLDEVLRDLDSLRLDDRARPSPDSLSGHIPHNPIIILSDSPGLALPAPPWGSGNSERDFVDILPAHLRDDTTVTKHHSKRIRAAFEYGFQTPHEARDAYKWLLQQNDTYGEERFRFLHSRDPLRGGRNVYKDPCRIGVLGARGCTKAEAAAETRGFISHTLGSKDQFTVLEPFVLSDVAIPRHISGANRENATEFIVYVTLRTHALARKAASAIAGFAIIGPEFAERHGKGGCKPVTVLTNWRDDKCERCSKAKPATGSCPCDYFVISIELDSGPIHERVLRELATKLKAHEWSFGSSRREKVRSPQRWATLHVRIPTREVAIEILDAYKAVGHISAYYIGLTLQDPEVVRCNACGLRDASCAGKGRGHLQAHEAGDRSKCPFHAEAPAELLQLEGWPRRTRAPRKLLAERAYEPASSSTHAVRPTEVPPQRPRHNSPHMSPRPKPARSRRRRDRQPVNLAAQHHEGGDDPLRAFPCSNSFAAISTGSDDSIMQPEDADLADDQGSDASMAAAVADLNLVQDEGTLEPPACHTEELQPTGSQAQTQQLIGSASLDCTHVDDTSPNAPRLTPAPAAEPPAATHPRRAEGSPTHSQSQVALGTASPSGTVTSAPTTPRREISAATDLETHMSSTPQDGATTCERAPAQVRGKTAAVQETWRTWERLLPQIRSLRSVPQEMEGTVASILLELPDTDLNAALESPTILQDHIWFIKELKKEADGPTAEAPGSRHKATSPATQSTSHQGLQIGLPNAHEAGPKTAPTVQGTASEAELGPDPTYGPATSPGVLRQSSAPTLPAAPTRARNALNALHHPACVSGTSGRPIEPQTLDLPPKDLMDPSSEPGCAAPPCRAERHTCRF